MKTCPVCKADIQSGFRDDYGVWHKSKCWKNPLKPIVGIILQEALEHGNMFTLAEASTWNGDAHLTITLTVEDVCNLASFAGYKFKPPVKTGAMRNTQRTVEPK
jgi:hypothetical protein